MRKWLCLLLAMFCAYASISQVTQLCADTVIILKPASSLGGELAVMNSTRSVSNGVLTNIGNGRTQFKKVLYKINDSTYLIGGDTLHLMGSGTSGWSIDGNSNTSASTNFLGTTNNQSLVFKANNAEVARAHSNGNFGIGMTNAPYKLSVQRTVSGGTVVAYFNNTASNTRLMIDNTFSSNSGFLLSTNGSHRFSNSVYQGNTGNIDFSIYNEQTSNPALFIDGDNSYMGIKKNNPEYTLDVKGTARVDTLPFVSDRDTLLTYDPSTRQLKVTKVSVPVNVKITSDQSTTSTSTSDVTGLSFSVSSGVYYKFKFVVVFRSAATSTGIKLGLNAPSSTVFSATGSIPTAADGTGGGFHGWINSSGDVVTATGVETSNTDYVAIIEGMILPSASGTIQLIFASGVSSSQVTVRTGSFGTVETY